MQEDKQKEAFDSILNGDNVFVTGSGGTGKSYTINKILDNNTILCAPTGIAALNIGGITCHKAFGLPIGLVTPSDVHKTPSRMQDLFNPYSPVKRIVIDEISILRRDYLELIDTRLKRIRGNKLPFGGLQVVVVGDFFQLNPIVTGQEKKIFYKEYDSAYGFSSNIWNFKSIELDKVYRQDNKRQVALLNSIRRKDKHHKKALDIVQAEALPYDISNNTTHICCYKRDADTYNTRFFNDLKTPIYTFTSKIEGEDKWKDSAVPHEIRLREGARVILKCNDIDGQYVNGETGYIKYLDKYSITVSKDNGKLVQVFPNTWDKFEYSTSNDSVQKSVTSRFTQMPVTLAYAQTAHSLQGVTLSNSVIDVGRGCFSHGQLYMMLSRVTDLKNMAIAQPLGYSDVRCDKEVRDFYKGMQEVI